MKTTHPLDREEVMAYVDGEVTATRAAAVRQHLENCAECRAMTADWHAVSARLAGWTVESSPVTLASFAGRTSAVWAMAPKSSPVGHLSRWFGRGRVLGVPRWTLVSVASLAVVVLAIAWAGTMNLRRALPDRQREYALASPAREGQGEQQGKSLLTQPIEIQVASGPMIVRTASMTLSTDAFDPMRAAIEALVAAHGGRIGSLSVAGEPSSGRALRAALRIPVTRLDAALAALRQLGKVTAESQSSEEVTDAYRDLTVRIANSKREEQRLIELLAKRTGDLADVLAVEQALARVRGDIEQMEAQERAMKGRVNDSTVTLQVTENRRAGLALGPLPLSTRFRNALVDGVTTAVEGVINVALGLLAAAPTLILWAIVLWWPVRRGWKMARGAGRPPLAAP